jgi:hypothetical protein
VSEDTSVGIAARDRAWRSRNWGSKPGKDKRFSLLQSFQTASGTLPASYLMGTGTFSPEIKLPGREADH